MVYTRSRFRPGDAEEFAGFIRRQRAAGGAFDADTGTPAQVLGEATRSGCLGIFLLKRNGKICASIQVDEELADGRVAVLSAPQVAPVCGVAFWRHLGTPLIRALVQSSLDRLVIAVDDLVEGRDFAPLRCAGFRLDVGRKAPVMVNYLPAILRHPAVRPLTSMGVAFVETQNSPPQRNGENDRIRCGRLGLFEYSWKGPDSEDVLQVLIDGERRQIVSIERCDWVACCFTASENPFRIHYRIRNKGAKTVAFCVEKLKGDSNRSRLQNLLPGQISSGDIFVIERSRAPTETTVIVEIAGGARALSAAAIRLADPNRGST